MFRRIITEEILKWKNSTGKKKALVIKGMVVVFFSILRCLIKWREPFTL